MTENKNSHISADAEQERFLEIERNLAKKNRVVNTALTTVFFAFILIFAALFWILPDSTLSEEENRSLQTMPSLTVQSLTDGTFSAEFSDYMADQFPFRNAFIGIKAVCEELLLKGENNGVFIADDGYLITRYDSIDEDILTNNLKYLSEFKTAAEDEGISVTFAFAGRTMDIAASKLPPYYGTEASDNARSALDSACIENSIEYIDLITPLKNAFENGDYVYYKTDHHWTTLGAFLAYETIADSASLEKHDISHYTVECASDAFYGTTWSKAGVKHIAPDTMEFFRYEGDGECLTSLDTGETINGLYKLSSLDTKDKYTAFLGGNTARCDIVSGEDKETIIVVKDSFAHSLVPFLSEDYNIVMIDLRYYSSPLIQLCKETNSNKIFFIYNLDTLANESGFRSLKIGLTNNK